MTPRQSQIYNSLCRMEKKADYIRKYLRIQLNKLPKKTPILLPPGAELAKEYPNQSVQAVLADLLEQSEDHYCGLVQVRRLFNGECGFQC